MYFAKNVKSTTHFNCSIEEGLHTIDFLRGNVSGLAIPTFIINAPKGLGKVPINKNKFIIRDEEIELSTWEGKKITFRNPKKITITER